MVLTDRWVRESEFGSSYKGYAGYKDLLGGKDDIGGPNQANPEALAFILWCPKAISEWFENPVILGLINELGLTPLPLVQTMSAFLTVFFVRELPLQTSTGVNLEKLPEKHQGLSLSSNFWRKNSKKVCQIFSAAPSYP